MAKKSSSWTIGNGANCPRDGNPMQRREHPPGWHPNPGQKVWFEYWDVCRRCGHVQHYETAKRFRGQFRPSPSPEKAPHIPRRHDRQRHSGNSWTGNVTHIYCGTVPPWDDSLGPFRQFTDAELRDPCITRALSA